MREDAFHNNRGSLIFQYKRGVSEKGWMGVGANKYTMNFLLKFYYQENSNEREKS